MTVNSPRTLLLVGSFPPQDSSVRGGVRTACKLLLESEFLRAFNVSFVDSTQDTTLPTGFVRRIPRAFRRICKLTRFLKSPPDYAIIFHVDSFSFLEKSIFATILQCLGTKACLFPRTNRIIDQCKKYPLLNLYSRVVFNYVEHVFVQGHNFSAFLIDDLRVKRTRTTVIPNWTASSYLLSQGHTKLLEIKRKERNSKRDKYEICYIGWLEKNKSVDTILEAISTFDLKAQDIHLHIIGTGSLEKALLDYVESLHISAAVTFHGSLAPEKVYPILRNSNALILPSLQEGCPNCVIESMCLGTPVISTKVGVLPDYFTHNASILYFDKKSSINLVENIQMLYDSEDLEISIANEAYAIVAKEFTIKSASTKFSRILTNY